MRFRSMYLVPAIAVISAIFGVVWGWIGVNAALHGGGGLAVLLIVFGFGGIALAMALWTTWRNMTSRKPPHASS